MRRLVLKSSVANVRYRYAIYPWIYRNATPNTSMESSFQVRAYITTSTLIIKIMKE